MQGRYGQIISNALMTTTNRLLTSCRRGTGHGRQREVFYFSGFEEELHESFRSGNGVCRRRRAWRSIVIHCARKALHGQIGTAEYPVRFSPPCTGKLRTSRRHDEGYIRVQIRDSTETRPIVRRQCAVRLKLQLGTSWIIPWAMVSARRFGGLRGA
jgi:hypothetical protein